MIQRALSLSILQTARRFRQGKHAYVKFSGDLRPTGASTRSNPVPHASWPHGSRISRYHGPRSTARTFTGFLDLDPLN